MVASHRTGDKPISIRTNNDKLYWRIYALLGLDELNLTLTVITKSIQLLCFNRQFISNSQPLNGVRRVQFDKTELYFLHSFLPYAQMCQTLVCHYSIRFGNHHYWSFLWHQCEAHRNRYQSWTQLFYFDLGFQYRIYCKMNSQLLDQTKQGYLSKYSCFIQRQHLGTKLYP